MKLIFVFLLLSGTLYGAWAHEGSASTVGDSAATSSVSVNCGSNPDRFLLGWVGVRSNAPTVSLSYGGVALSPVDNLENTEVGLELHLFRLVGPASGSNVLSATLSTATDHFLGGMCFSGINPTAPNDGVSKAESGAGTAASQTVTSEIGDVVVGCVLTHEDATALTVGAGQTSRTSQSDVGGVYLDALCSTEPGASSVTFSNSWTVGAPYNQMAVNLNASGVGGGGAGLKTFWVGSAGNDSNSCATAESSTAANRKLTISSALTCARAGVGDTVIVGNGTYPETLIDEIPAGLNEFTRTTLKAENSRQATIKGLSGQIRIITFASNKDFIRVEGFVIDGNYGGGNVSVTIDFGDPTLADYVEFVDCDIKNSLDSLIFWGGDHNRFANCTMSHAVGSGTLNQDHLLYAGKPTNAIVENNIFNDAPGYGIHFFYQPNADTNTRTTTATVTGNTFFNCRSGAAICNTCAAATFNNNVLYDNGESLDGWGGFRVQQSNNVKFLNNTFDSNGTGFGGTAAIQVTGSGSFASTGTVIQNNLFFNNVATIAGCDAPGCSQNFNQTATSSPFTNAATHDYTLVAGSLPIGAGTNLSSIFTTDKAGNARPPAPAAWSIGAYEYTVATPSITLQNPNGGQTIQIGSAQSVTWSSANLSGTGIRIREDQNGDGTPETTLAAAAPDTGVFNYTASGAANANRKMEVCDADGSPCDLSDAVYSAVASAPGSITITFPVTGVHVFPGQTIPITWNSSNISGNVRIHAWHDNVEMVVSSSYPFNGTDFVWSIPFGLSSSSNWYVEVTSLNDLNIFDWSENFRIGSNKTSLKQ